MRRLGYLLLETLAVYVILTAFTALIVFGGHGFGQFGQIVFIFFCFVNIFGAFRLALVGESRGLWRGFYRPVRPVQMASEAISAMRHSNELPRHRERRDFAIDYSGTKTLPAYEIINALADVLEDLGIKHTHSDALIVEDNRSVWRIEPVHGQRRLIGWVTSDDTRDIEQVIEGIRDFLAHDLGLHAHQRTGVAGDLV